jgi:hypothetical protein
MKAWVLTQFYQCPEFDWPWPVCSSYGDAPYCPQQPVDPVNTGGWALVHMHTTYQHIEAMKLDPRVLYCGQDYDAPPQQMLDTYKQLLDPNVNYMFIGQVIAKLAQSEPCFAECNNN